MTAPQDEHLATLIEQSLRLDHLEGAVSVVDGGYTTGWRSLPFTVVAQWRRSAIRLEADGHAAAMVPDGSLLVLPSGLRHRVTTLGARRVECRWAHVQATVLGAHDLVPLLELAMVHAPDAGERVGAACQRIAALPAAGTDLIALTARKAATHQLLAALAALAPPGHAGLRMIARSERLLPILRFVHEHWSQPIGRDELARRAALSPSRFHALFLETMGVPPLTYLRRLRMQQAQRLLVTTEEPVSRVGEQVGYPDAFQFSRQFRRVWGLSPSAYRERMRLPAMRPRESAAASGDPL